MLNREAIENIQLIKDTANFVWGTQCRFGEVQVIDSPYSEFNLPMRLYDLYDILLEYERATLGIMVKNDLGYTGLSRLSTQQVFRGFESLKPANLLHNFRVLDQFIRGNEFSEQKVN